MYTVYTSLPFETVAKIEYIWKHGRLRLVIIYIIGKQPGETTRNLPGGKPAGFDNLNSPRSPVAGGLGGAAGIPGISPTGVCKIIEIPGTG